MRSDTISRSALTSRDTNPGAIARNVPVRHNVRGSPFPTNGRLVNVHSIT